jgi:hypothetical protein
MWRLSSVMIFAWFMLRSLKPNHDSARIFLLQHILNGGFGFMWRFDLLWSLFDSCYGPWTLTMTLQGNFCNILCMGVLDSSEDWICFQRNDFKFVFVEFTFWICRNTFDDEVLENPGGWRTEWRGGFEFCNDGGWWALYRRYTALHASDSLLTSNSAGGENACGNVVDEVVGHVYLFLKEKLELAAPSCSYGLLHSTMIGLCLSSFSYWSQQKEKPSKLFLRFWRNVLSLVEQCCMVLKQIRAWICCSLIFAKTYLHKILFPQLFKFGFVDNFRSNVFRVWGGK